MVSPRQTTTDFLWQHVDQARAFHCVELYELLHSRFPDNSGSTHNHQAWPGGLWDHLNEVLNLGYNLYQWLSATGRPLPFTLSSAMVCLFFHDLDKPGAFEPGSDGQLQRCSWRQTKEQCQHFRLDLARRHDIDLSPEEINAIKYAEGELNDYSSKQRVMNELAAFVHACDILSARLWYDYPLSDNDPWSLS